MPTTRLAQRRRVRSADNAFVRSRRLLPALSLAAIAFVGCTVPPPVAGLPGTPTSTTTTAPAPAPTPVAPTPPKPVGVAGTWNLKFADEFNGTALDRTKWQPGWWGSNITAPVNPEERQCYDARQATVSGGALHLALVARNQTCGGVARSWVSGFVNSNPTALGAGKGYQFSYGLVEWRAFVPADAAGKCANWPALWSDGQTWPKDGEIDTYECLTNRHSWHLHSSSTGAAADGPGGYPAGTFTGWHTFAANWQPGSVTFYYDGKVVGSHAFTVSSPHYLIMNNASGKTTPVAADLKVDYVRVWQR
jgi:beta-glucanase (GH16 family)